MTQLVGYDTTAGAKSEDQLWTEYMVTLARMDECWRLNQEAWRQFVTDRTARHSWAGDLVTRYSSLHAEWMTREKAAYVAWKAVAYPLGGMSVN